MLVQGLSFTLAHNGIIVPFFFFRAQSFRLIFTDKNPSLRKNEKCTCVYVHSRGNMRRAWNQWARPFEVVKNIFGRSRVWAAARVWRGCGWFLFERTQGGWPVFNLKKWKLYSKPHWYSVHSLTRGASVFSVLRLGQKDYDGEIHVRVTTVTL